MTIEEMELEFERLEMENPIVSRCMGLHQCDGMPLEQALKYAVVALAKQNKEYFDLVMEKAHLVGPSLFRSSAQSQGSGGEEA